MNMCDSRFGDNNLIAAAFNALLFDTKAMVFVKDANLVYVAASMPFANMVGKKSVDEIVGYTDFEIFEDQNLAKRYVGDDHRLIADGQNLIDYIEPITDNDGHARYGATSKYILKDSEGKFIGLLGITRDITRDYMARQHYQQELKYLFELPDSTYAACYIDVDNWRIITQRKRSVNGKTIHDWHSIESVCESAVETIVDKDSDVAMFYKSFTSDNLKQIYESGRNSIGFEYQRELADGSIKWVQNEVKFLTNVDDGHLCVMIFVKDIDDEKRKEQEIHLSAKMDKMTMVYNRETTMQAIKEILNSLTDKRHALFMIDVDNFKKLNDTLGHQAGDEFLVEIASIIKNNFRQNDIVGRVGGDEFFALMQNVPNNKMIHKKADEILKNVAELCKNYTDINLSVSIGISIYPVNGISLEELYLCADDLMYQSKKCGKNQYMIAEHSTNK